MSDLYFSKTIKARMVSINLEMWSMRLEVANLLRCYCNIPGEKY